MDSYIFNSTAPAADARISYGPEEFHFGDLRLPAGTGPHPVVIIIHGGFWRAKYDLEFMGHMAAAFTALNYATWNIEFRRIGQPGGGWPGTLQDVAQASDFLRQIAPAYHLDLNRVIALGHSAGGHLVCWLAGRKNIPHSDLLYNSNPLELRGVVSLAGVVNLKQGWELNLGDNVIEALMGGPPEQFPERYATASPYELLPSSIPQILVHGDKDDTVPLIISQDYYEKGRATNSKIELITLPGAGHFEVIDALAAEFGPVSQAVQQLLA